MTNGYPVSRSARYSRNGRPGSWRRCSIVAISSKSSRNSRSRSKRSITASRCLGLRRRKVAYTVSAVSLITFAMRSTYWPNRVFNAVVSAQQRLCDKGGIGHADLHCLLFAFCRGFRRLFSDETVDEATKCKKTDACRCGYGGMLRRFLVLFLRCLVSRCKRAASGNQAAKRNQKQQGILGENRQDDRSDCPVRLERMPHGGPSGDRSRPIPTRTPTVPRHEAQRRHTATKSS